MPSAERAKQWPAESPTKKQPSSTAGRIRCGIRLPWWRTAGTPNRAAVVGGRLLHGDAGIVRRRADPHLVAGRDPPAVAAPDERPVDDDVERVAGAVRVHLEPA